ncbi:centromere protein F-like isoform X2 [Planococcus citri]|uniref:centromere protein F-like isoform X2 n=1 Tax=Planococcus citri TaxID=170843 RepID=UPI0031F77EBB
MSFSKAKLHRFNEEIPCAPPPGTYNPAPVDKTVGPKINKCERFNDGKGIFATASCESLNEVDGCKTPFALFKTPKIPLSSGKFEMKRNSNFSQRKASSTEYICKKYESSSYEINSLKCSLNDLQEELALERNKTNNLVNEIQRLKESFEESDQHTDALINVLSEKTNLIAILEEKCSTLETITAESFDSYYKHVTGVYSVFETYFKSWEKSESDFALVFQKYENLVSNYESYFEEISSFMSDVLRKNNEINFAQDLTTKSPVEIVAMLQESEKERKKYELVVNEMQKVITVLGNRVLESDQEVENLNTDLSSVNDQNKKFSDLIHEKDEEITTLRSLVNEVAMNFLNEVKTSEKDLLSLIDILKEKALLEKKTYEKQLIERNAMISRLRLEKSHKELQLQESLDMIETLKCKEQNTEQVLDQVRNECCELKSLLQECQEQLRSQRTFYDENYLSDISGELNLTFTKESPQCIEFSSEHAFVKQLFEFTAQQMNSSNEKASLYETLQSDFENKPIQIEDIKTEWEKLPGNKIEWLQSLLNLVQTTLYKFNSENTSLKNQNTRLRADFVEKCDECGELTRLLQVSEKRAENFEKRAEQAETVEKELKQKLETVNEEIEALKNEKLSLEEKLTEQLFETKNNEVVIQSLTEDLDKLRQQLDNQTDNADKTKLESLLKESQSRLRVVEKENAKLNKLIGPFRQTLERYEEKRPTAN